MGPMLRWDCQLDNTVSFCLSILFCHNECLDNGVKTEVVMFNETGGDEFVQYLYIYVV